MKTLRIDLIQAEMDRRGLSQSDVARELGLTRQGVNAFMMGKNLPSPRTRRALLELLKLDLDDVYREEKAL